MHIPKVGKGISQNGAHITGVSESDEFIGVSKPGTLEEVNR